MSVLQGSGCSKQGDGCEGYGYAGKEVVHLSCYGIVPASVKGQQGAGMPCEALSPAPSTPEVVLPSAQLPTAAKVEKEEVKEEEEEGGAFCHPAADALGVEQMTMAGADQGAEEEEDAATAAPEVPIKEQVKAKGKGKRGRSALEEEAVGVQATPPRTRRRLRGVPVCATPAAVGDVPSQVVTGGEGEEQAGATVPVLGPKQPSKGSGKGKKGSSGGKGKGKGKGGRSAHNRVVEVVAVRRSTRLRRGA
jgi:hypothetical protein